MSTVHKNKDELLSAIHKIYPKLMLDYRAVPISLSRVIAIEGNIRATQISVCDTLAYLVGWGKLVIKWIELKNRGAYVYFPEQGYKWSELGLLAAKFHEEYKDIEYTDLISMYGEVMNSIVTIIEKTSNKALYEDLWYDKWTLGRMIQFNTVSPMKNMRAKVRRFIKTYVKK